MTIPLDSNKARVERAGKLLHHYAALVGESLFGILADDLHTGVPMQAELIDWVLTDLLHYCSEHNINFDLRLVMARDHFREEKGAENGEEDPAKSGPG